MRMATHGNVFFFMCFVLLYIVMYLYILYYIIMYLYILYIVQCCYILFTYIFNRILIFFPYLNKIGVEQVCTQNDASVARFHEMLVSKSCCQCEERGPRKTERRKSPSHCSSACNVARGSPRRRESMLHGWGKFVFQFGIIYLYFINVYW